MKDTSEDDLRTTGEGNLNDTMKTAQRCSIDNNVRKSRPGTGKPHFSFH
jgi:hypothetical protein